MAVIAAALWILQEVGGRKYILGCAVFIDDLNPCLLCSKSLQSDKIDVLGALTSLLKTVSETDKLSAKLLEQWPTFAATQKKCTVENCRKVYQCQELVRYKQAVDYYKPHYAEHCTKRLSLQLVNYYHKRMLTLVHVCR